MSSITGQAGTLLSTLYISPSILVVYKNATGDLGLTYTVTVYTSGTVLTKNLTGNSIKLEVWKGDPTQPLLSSTNVAFDGTSGADGIVIWTPNAADLTALPYSLDGLNAALRFYVSTTFQETTDTFTLIVRPTS